MGIKKFTTRAQLHHKVQILLVVVSFEILNDIGVVHLFKQINLIHNVCQIFLRHLMLIQHFDSNLKLIVHLVNTFVNFAKGALPKDTSIYFILHLQLVNTSCHMH